MNSITTTTDILPILQQLEGLRGLGQVLIKSGMLPKDIKTPESAIAIMLKGRELGVGPMEAFSSINVIEGKPTISPQLMIALAERTGQLEDFKIVDDGEVCTVTVTRRGRTPFSASFSMKDAEAQNLTGKYNWKSMPKVMRQWRAVSAAFRPVFADVLAGLYIPEEMGADVTEDGDIVQEVVQEKEAHTELEHGDWRWPDPKMETVIVQDPPKKIAGSPAPVIPANVVEEVSEPVETVKVATIDAETPLKALQLQLVDYSAAYAKEGNMKAAHKLADQIDDLDYDGAVALLGKVLKHRGYIKIDPEGEEPEETPWIKSGGGIAWIIEMTELKAAVGDEEYYKVLAKYNATKRTEITDAGMAEDVSKELRSIVFPENDENDAPVEEGNE